MAPKRVKHTQIPNERLRKSTLKRRLENLYKKANELSILCNIEMFIVLLNPKGGSATMWPSHDKAMNGIEKFINFPEQERLKRMVLQEKLLTDKVQEMTEKVSMLRKKNEETEMRILMKQVIDGKSFGELGLDQMNGLNHLIDEDLERLQKRRDELDEMEGQSLGTSVFAEGNQGGEPVNSLEFNEEGPAIISS